jgi:uncharacterized protein with GYD domain
MLREDEMALYLYQLAYTPESWAAQVKSPANRVENVARAAVESVGGKFIGGWLCFGEYDVVAIFDVPNEESMAGIAIAVAAGGAVKASKTTVLMTAAQGIEALKHAATVGKTYKPAR